MIKRFLVRAALIFICLFIWVPLLLMAGNALMSEGEMLQRFGAIFGMGNAPVKAVFLPEYPTLRPLVELLPWFLRHVLELLFPDRHGFAGAAGGCAFRRLGICLFSV